MGSSGAAVTLAYEAFDKTGSATWVAAVLTAIYALRGLVAPLGVTSPTPSIGGDS